MIADTPKKAGQALLSDPATTQRPQTTINNKEQNVQAL